MKRRLKSLLRPLYYSKQRWLAKAQGVLWLRSDPIDRSLCGLDIGCGPKKRPGFIGVDQFPSSGVDIICDLESGLLPFASNSIDLVYANQVLEHIANLEGLLAEISRVMKPGAKLQVGVPYAGNIRAFQDPTHVRFYTIKTFEYFVEEGARVGGWYLPKPFTRVVRRSLVFGGGPIALLISIIVNRKLAFMDFYEASFLRIFAARDLHIELEK